MKAMQKLKKQLPPLSSLLPFEATARLGSITQAADELGLTQAAISRQIKALEDNLGVSLFERRNRAIFLSEEGREFEKIVAEAMGSIATHATHLRGQSVKNEVVLLSQLCESFYWLMPSLSTFYQHHPNIRVRVSATTTPISQTTERFDLAVQTSSRQSGRHALVFTASDEIFPVCSPNYLADKKLPLSLDELASHHLLHHNIEPQEWMEWNDWLKHVAPDIKINSKGSAYESYLLVIQAAIEGHGIALGWRRTTENLLKAGSLVRPCQESVYLPEGLSIYQHAYSATNGETRPEVEALLDWLRDELS